MSRTSGSLKLSSNLEILAGAPIDARSIVPTKADLTVAANFEYSYVGMIVAVQSEGKAYILQNKPTTEASNWVEIGSGVDLTDYYTKEEVDALVSSVYKPAGSCAYASLPELGASVLGNVYSVTDSFTTDNRFVEGTGKNYPAGSNVVVVNIGTSGSHNYKFDVLPGFIDLTGYQEKFQVTSIPTAASGEVGKIYQYIGTTTVDYTNGYFYECIEDSSTVPSTYSWVAKAVQEADGSAGALENALTASVNVGGIKAGDNFIAGTEFETLFRDLLNPTLYPTLTAPTATISATGDKLIETGDTLSTTMTVTFNRGSISPAYGTSGYRSGAASAYSLNGGESQVNNEFVVTVDGSQLTYQATVNYTAGEQPKDSSGSNYDAPLEAGTVNTNTITYEFVDALWANTSSISTVSKLSLVSKSTGVKNFVFPAATVSNPEVFDVPASWTVTGVEVLNTLSNNWESCANEFSITDVTHEDASSTSVNYKRYTCNLGYAMASRQIRVKWS